MTYSIPFEKMLDECKILYAMKSEAPRTEYGYPRWQRLSIEPL